MIYFCHLFILKKRKKKKSTNETNSQIDINLTERTTNWSDTMIHNSRSEVAIGDEEEEDYLDEVGVSPED